MPFSLFVYHNIMVPIAKTTKNTTLAQDNFFCLVEIYQIMQTSIHLIKVENTGPERSGPVVHVVIGVQKLIRSARRDMGDLKKADSLISWAAYLDLKRFY